MMVKIRAHGHSLEARKRSVSKWKIADSTRNDLLRFVAELDLGKVNKGRKISEGRQAKYLDMLKVPLEFFGKPMEQTIEADIERFEKALSSDKIISRLRRKPYAQATKADIRKALKVFFKWKFGPAEGVRLAGWLDTHVNLKTPDYLKEQEIEKLFRKCRTAEQRFVVAILFDSGARAEEFLNIRYEDIIQPEGKENFVKLALKQEYSKTMGRTVSLYWRYSREAVLEYVQERIAQGMKPKDPVYPNNYDSLRMFLGRLGRETLKRPVHPHLFRHSSATYYATRMNRQELCYRYGWRFSSNMPDIYISRAGMENKDLDTKFTSTELSSLKDDLVKLQQEAKIKDERILRLEKHLQTITEHLPVIAQIMEHQPATTAVETALRQKKGLAA